MLRKILFNNVTILCMLLIVAGVAHGFNMFHFPYFEDDEGTYIAQAWSFLDLHRLAPYTYWYEHAPFGWICIAMWAFFTKGFFTFGFSLNSGRLFMLILHLFDVVMLYGIAKKLFRSNFIGIVSVLLFSLSPLGIFFQRRILLDNVMTSWLLLSFYIILGEKRKLIHNICSAIFFGFAVLSKETAIFLFPAFLYIVFTQTNTSHKKMQMVLWAGISGSIISFYVVYAILKGELFPVGTLLGGSHPHVSLVQSFLWQSARKGGFFLSPTSDFWNTLVYGWMARDAPFTVFGVVASIGNLLFAIRNKSDRILSVIIFCFWLFYIRGGIVIDFYIIPFVPFLALSIAVMFEKLLTSYAKPPLKYFMVIPGLLTLFVFLYTYMHNTNIYTVDQTTAQTEAVSWIEKHLSKSTIIVSDNYAFLDLNKNMLNIYVPSGTQYYWKIDTDPQVKKDVLHNSWKNIAYLVVTPQLIYDADHAGLNLVEDAYKNSSTIQKFNGSGWDIDIRKVQNTK